MFRKFIPLALLALLWLYATAAMAQAPAGTKYPVLSTRCEPTSITVGDQVKLTVSAVVPELQRLIVRDPFSEKNQTTWTLVGKAIVTDEKISPNEWRRNTEYTLTTFELGEVEIPPIEVRYQAPGVDEPVVRTASGLSVKVNSVLPADAAAIALADIKDPIPIALPRWVNWVAAGLVGLVLALLAFLVWRHMRGKIGQFINPQLRPDEWALLQIENLEREKLIEQKKVKELYTRLSDTLRQYLGKTYELKAMDMTTGELLTRLEDAESEELPARRADFSSARQRLCELLDEAGLVKFAQFVPEASRSRHALEKAREVVRLSRYKLEPPPADAAQPPAQFQPPPPPPPPAPNATQREYETHRFAARPGEVHR